MLDVYFLIQNYILAFADIEVLKNFMNRPYLTYGLLFSGFSFQYS